MKLFGKQIGKKNEPEVPPDFSTPPGDMPQPSFSDNAFKDPLQGSYDEQLGTDPFQTPQGQDQYSNFGNDIFSSDSPTNADRARAYAKDLGGKQEPGGQGQTASFAGAVTGHEAQLILEKLDTIKAELDAVKQRMMRIERFIEQAEQKASPKPQQRLW